MDIRETLNRYSKSTAIVVVCVIAIGVVVIGLEVTGNSGRPPAKNFFTTDDGQSWFVDSANKLPPFDHNGKPAVRCYVFKGKNGEFAGLLEKYSDDTRKLLMSNAKRPTSIPILVKRPGEKEWQNISPEQEGAMLMQISGRSDSGIEIVMP